MRTAIASKHHRASAAVSVFLLPDAVTPGAWRLARRGETISPTVFPTLTEAATALGTGEDFILALPLELGLIARYRLPDASPAEWRDMVRIQLEKILPYADADLVLACAPVPPATPAAATGVPHENPAATATGEVTVAAYVVHRARLAELCQGLAALGRWPRQTVFGVHLRAASAVVTSPGARPGTSLLVYPEWGRVVVTVLETGRPTFAQALPAGLSPEGLAGELPPLLLGAELEGVPTDFSRLYLAEDLPAPWAEVFRAALPAPAKTTLPLLPAATKSDGSLLTGGGRPQEEVDLSLPTWQEERRRAVRAGITRRRLWWAAGVYLALVLLGFADLARLHYLQRRYDRQLADAQAPIARLEAARRHWQALAPAFDFRLSAVEILDQVRQCLPANDQGDLRLTLFELNRLRTPGVLTIAGEAPSYQAATEFGDRLKTRGELRDFRLNPETPVILPNGRASFRIVGRLP